MHRARKLAITFEGVIARLRLCHLMKSLGYGPSRERKTEKLEDGPYFDLVKRIDSGDIKNLQPGKDLANPSHVVSLSEPNFHDFGRQFYCMLRLFSRFFSSHVEICIIVSSCFQGSASVTNWPNFLCSFILVIDGNIPWVWTCWVGCWKSSLACRWTASSGNGSFGRWA